MLDHRINKIIHPIMNGLANHIPRQISANVITLVGFVVGLIVVPLLWFKMYLPAIVVILVNRFFDGLDGAVARKNGRTNFGGYLDIICDFIFYSAVVIGFAIADLEKNGLTVIFLLFSFVGTGTSFLAFAAIEKKNDIFKCEKGQKGFYYMKGLIEGSETIAFYIMICIFPDYFSILGIIFGFLCWITVLGRIFSAYTLLDRK